MSKHKSMLVKDFIVKLFRHKLPLSPYHLNKRYHHITFAFPNFCCKHLRRKEDEKRKKEERKEQTGGKEQTREVGTSKI